MINIDGYNGGRKKGVICFDFDDPVKILIPRRISKVFIDEATDILVIDEVIETETSVERIVYVNEALNNKDLRYIRLEQINPYVGERKSIKSEQFCVPEEKLQGLFEQIIIDYAYFIVERKSGWKS